MNQSPLNQFAEKLFTFLKKVKELLSKDYSMQDLKNLKSLPKTLQKKFSEVQGDLSKTSASTTLVSSSLNFEIKQLPSLLQRFVIERRNAVVLLFVVLLLLLVNLFAIAPYSQRVQNQLDMRPAQWSQLQSLIKLAKSSSASSQTPSYSPGIATVTLLDDMEMQKIRSVLTTRGLKTNVLRLTADNPPRIEFQASDAMFSVLLDTLDELRTTWRLYPEQLNIISTSGAGMVNISGVLVQYGGQAGMSQ
jgi:predicted PurR-regulated permease PerM